MDVESCDDTEPHAQHVWRRLDKAGRGTAWWCKGVKTPPEPKVEIKIGDQLVMNGRYYTVKHMTEVVGADAPTVCIGLKDYFGDYFSYNNLYYKKGS